MTRYAVVREFPAGTVLPDGRVLDAPITLFHPETDEDGYPSATEAVLVCETLRLDAAWTFIPVEG